MRSLINPRTNQLAGPLVRRAYISPRTNALAGVGCSSCAGQCGALGATTPPGGSPGTSQQIKDDLLAVAWNFLQSLFTQHPKDKSRYDRNWLAYRDALNGNCEALRYLKQRSGRYGIVVVNYAPSGETPGTAIGGWATEGPQADALKKYGEAAPFCNMPVDPIPNPTAPPATSEMPSPDEIQAAVNRMMQNIPIGRDGLRWIALGYITASQVAAAQQQWGTALYQRGGALDPAQASVVSIPPLNFGGWQTAALVGGGILLVGLLMSSGGRSRRR